MIRGLNPPEHETSGRQKADPLLEEKTHARVIRPIGFIRSCFGEKFATPRQPGLCPSACARLVFEDGFRNPDTLRGLDGFSHLWLIFGFHATQEHGWHPTVRPPRLGGKERVGVFATRSTFRPNGLGLSVVRLEAVHTASLEGPRLDLSGIDLIDGTPVYDIKPYLAYAESIPDARSGFADLAIPRLRVTLASSAQTVFQDLTAREQTILLEALSLDPRPAASPADPSRVYGVHLCGRNIRFTIQADHCEIQDISPPDPPPASRHSR